MNKLVIGLLMSIFGSSIVAGEKIYTQEEMDKIINKKILEKIKITNSKNIVKFSESLIKKEQDLKKMEMMLKRKEEEFQINSKELNEKIDRFVEKQKKFIGCIDNVEKGKRKRINHLVEIIGGMKPTMAGSVLSVQDSSIAVKILSELPAIKMSKIFNSMDKEISARLQKQYMNMKR